MITVTHIDGKIILTAKFEDKDGNDVTAIATDFQWINSNPNLALLAPAEDGLSAVLVPFHRLGSSGVAVKADADPTENYEHVGSSVQVTFKQGFVVFSNFASTFDNDGISETVEIPLPRPVTQQTANDHGDKPQIAIEQDPK